MRNLITDAALLVGGAALAWATFANLPWWAALPVSLAGVTGLGGLLAAVGPAGWLDEDDD